MKRSASDLRRRPIFGAICVLFAGGMVGCSSLDNGHVLTPTQPPAHDAIAYTESTFVAQPFSLIAADSVGLATFGMEIASWADAPSNQALALKHAQDF